MKLQQKSHTYASLGTILFMVLLFLLLWFLYLGTPVVEEEEGIEVALGMTEEGGGYMPDPTPPAPSETVAPPPAASTPSHSDLLTQEDEESLALQRQRKEEERKRKAEEAERLRQQREEQARLEAERVAKEKALAEQRAKEQAAIDKANAFGSLFGNNGSDAKGSGDSRGDGQKGNPAGHGSIGGNQWSLAGRDIKQMPAPSDTFTQEGKVVVAIRVNAAGDVTEAKLGTGSTISDQATISLAIEAAKKAKFSSSDNPTQIGSITYYFKFK